MRSKGWGLSGAPVWSVGLDWLCNWPGYFGQAFFSGGADAALGVQVGVKDVLPDDVSGE